MKKFLFVLLLALAGGGAYYWYSGREEANVAAEAGPRLADISKGPIVDSVDTTGRVVAHQDVEIKCKASGQIVKVPFDVSDTVRMGQLLVELDPTDQQRFFEQTNVALKVSEARLAQARLNLELAVQGFDTKTMRAETALKAALARQEEAKLRLVRLRELQQRNQARDEEIQTAITQAVQADIDVENAKIGIQEVALESLTIAMRAHDVELAEAEYAADTIALALARQGVLDTKVVAPIDGVVAVRSVEPGQIISSGISNVGGGTPVLTLSDLTHLYIFASVDESDIGRVAVGQKAKVTADAYPKAAFEGRVVRIATRGVNTSNVVTFEVRIEVVSKNRSLLKPEMTANVQIIVDSVDEALRVPVEAVRREEGGRFVEIALAGGKTEKRSITTGVSDGELIEVKSGVAEGDQVVLPSAAEDSRWRGMSFTRGVMMIGGGGRGGGGGRR